MRRLLIGLTLIILSLFTHENIQAQNCLNTGLNGTTISLPCNVNCTQLKMKVPHLKSTSDYTLVDIPYTPYPYTTSTGTELTALYVDDVFSSSIPLPFSFCFWDSTYTKAIVGSNGIITFDELHGTGTCGNSYN